MCFVVGGKIAGCRNILTGLYLVILIFTPRHFFLQIIFCKIFSFFHGLF